MSLISEADFLALLFWGMALAAIGYLGFALICIKRWRPKPSKYREHLPAMTIFKPVRGKTETLADNLESFCKQDYPNLQIIFGVADKNDEALPIIHAVMEKHPDLDITLSIGWDNQAANPKIATALPMANLAKHAIWVLADSDVRVPSHFLATLAESFKDPSVGAATALYRATGKNQITSKLGAMSINEWFLPSALVAHALGPLKFCFGAVMAVRKEVLDDIGGLEALGENLADDFMLGHLTHKACRSVALIPMLVETESHETDLKSMLWREIRWGRTIRSMQPAGYFGSILTYAIPLAALGLIFAPFSPITWAIFALSLTLRLAIHLAVRHFLGVSEPAAVWLVPLRDVIGISVWLTSYVRRTVDWRGRVYRVEPGGRMKPVGTEP